MRGFGMKEDRKGQEEDARADALAAVLLVVIAALAVIYWLSGLPTS